MTSRRFVPLALLSLATLVASTPDVARAAADEVSFVRDVQPIFQQSCVACHKPEKRKGKLDLTTHAGVLAGGGGGKTVVPGKPAESDLVEQVVPHGTDAPAMPEKGEPLAAAQVDVLRRWIEQGAKDDTDPSTVARHGFARPGPAVPTTPTPYVSQPVITALALSPDGQTLAVAGRMEVLLVASTGEPQVLARLPFGSPRITGLVFAAGGQQLVAAGGAPGRHGHVQVWDVPSRAVRQNWQVSDDTVFGLSVSADGTRAAVGCADRTARVVALADGREILNVPAHSDWVFGAAISADGANVVTAGRDRAVKRMDVSAQVNPSAAAAAPTPVIVDIAEPAEPATCVARSPGGEIAVVGAADGAARIYRVADLKPRTETEKDPNRVKECERMTGPINAIAFSPDGKSFALAATREARVFDRDGNRTAMLVGHDGPVYAMAFTPDAARLYTGGHDGKVRVFDAEDGKLLSEFAPFPPK